MSGKAPIPRGNPVTCDSNGISTSSEAIIASPGLLVDFIVFTDGVNQVTATLYDNPSAASGKVLAKAIIAGADQMGGEVNIWCDAVNGIYLEISGTGGEALVRYAK